MHPEVPIKTIHLFAELDHLLIDVLYNLPINDWERTTLSPHWNIKDIAAHLLDGNIRSLSTSRDHFFEKKMQPLSQYKEVVAYLNRINNDWVNIMRKISPQVIIELLTLTNVMYADHLGELDPFARSIYPVGWAGESESQNWFHIAREYTEKWHHQQQIRSAIGEETILFSPALFRPYVETSLRAIPYHLKDFNAREGECVAITIKDVDTYYLVMSESGWIHHDKGNTDLVSRITIDPKVIWKMFSKEISTEEVVASADITGNNNLANKILGTVAVMA